MDKRSECMKLGELPEDCLANIFGHTTILDVVRLACVSKAFASAARSDTVWSMLLPSDYARIYPEAKKCGSKREIVDALSKGVSLVEGAERYVLLRSCIGVCRYLSSTSMSMLGGDDGRYWRFDYSKSSYFSKVAHLLAVCSLEVTGTWNLSVPPGSYSVLWRLRVANPHGGRHRYLSWQRPVIFRLTIAPEGENFDTELDLGLLQNDEFYQWFDFEIAQIVVSGERMVAQELQLVFSMTEADNSFWKGGLYIDGVIVRPSRNADKERVLPTRGDARQQLYTMTLRRGVF